MWEIPFLFPRENKLIIGAKKQRNMDFFVLVVVLFAFSRGRGENDDEDTEITNISNFVIHITMNNDSDLYVI